MSTTVQQDRANDRFELLLDGERIGELDYVRGGGEIDLVHTEVEHSQRAGGLGGELVKGALDLIRSGSDDRVIATCAFTAAWIAKNDDYQDLLSR